MNTRGSAGMWGIILFLTVVCATLAWVRLADLPDLGMLLGPDLTVRQVAVERSAAIEGQPFQRGDRLIALEGMSVEELRDLRTVLPPLVQEARIVEGEAVEEGAVLLTYQIWRPEHRFSLAMQGEPIDPTALPPGVEPDDRLVEIDGRLLPGKVGVEGIRSVTASRPDALLGLERRNAVFSGQMKVAQPTNYPAFLLIFLIVFLVILALWRYHSEAVGPKGAYCIALETLCLGWLSLLMFNFQWVLADHLLAIGVVAGLVLMRPLALLARESTEREPGRGGLISLVIGIATTGGIAALMNGGYLAGPEEAMQVAAIVAGLFIIYELAANGMEKSPAGGAGERGGYLLGIVALGLFATVVAAVREPVLFEEDQWRWFAVSLLSLVWFGDVLFGLKYGVRSAMGEVADQGARRKLVQDYLSEIALEMPHTDLRIVGKIDDRAIALFRDQHSLEIGVVSDNLVDAVDILIQENARIPLPEGIERTIHPMEGIARAMHISIALPLTSPPGSLNLGASALDLALVGVRQSRGDGDIPGYASTATLDLAQELWSGAVASAASLEILSAMLSSQVPAAPAPGTQVSGGPDLRKELEQAQEVVEKANEELDQVQEELGQTRQTLLEQQSGLRLRQLTTRAHHPALFAEAEFLEAELLQGMDFLLQGPEPIVIGGTLGSGKCFVAQRAHLLEGRSPEDFLLVDMGEPGAAKTLDVILGEIGGGVGPGLLQGFQGSLLIRSAQRCNDPRMLALCHQAEEKGVRLYLSFQSAHAEERSVLEGRPPTIQELLAHREVIIPRLCRRATILRPLLQFWLEEWAFRYGKPIDGFARKALEALEHYHYPGEVVEAVEIVRLAVLDAKFDVVDRENLPAHVR